MSTNKLQKFLLRNSSEMIRSDTTYSRYFKIKNIIVRLSEHISFKNNCDLQIIIPTNDAIKGMYTVIFGDSYKTIIWNTQQIIDFIPSLILTKEMNTKSVFKKDDARSLSAVQKLEMAQKIEHHEKLVFNKCINSKINIKFLGAEDRAIVRHSKSHWTVNEINRLHALMHKEFNRGDSINEDFQIFLSCTSVTYLDIINLYKIIVIDNDRVPTIELLKEAYEYIRQ